MGNGNFKVGDRVKRIARPYDDIKIGTTGIVTKINEGCDTVRVKIDGMSKEGTWAYSYIEKVENPTVAIIQHKGRETIATLKDGKTVLKTEKATCNPSDTFNAEFGRALALARLNDDQKMIDWLLKGEEKPFIPTQSRIVKQDKYEVGDKVKVKEALKAGELPDGLHVASAMTELKGKIVTIKEIRRTPDRYEICEGRWVWSGDCFEGKIIEEPVASGQPVAVPVITPLDWEGFKAGRFAVHCNTEEKAKQFFDELKIQGIKWCNGKELTDTKWNLYKESTHYGFYNSSENGICYGTFNGRIHVKVPYTPNYRVIKRPAKVGEWIKVVSPDSTMHEGYRMGDLIHVDELTRDTENGIVIKPFHIVQREYIVLEPITPAIETVTQPEPQYKEVKRKAEIGDLIKIVKVGHHNPRLILGDIHKVNEENVCRGLHTDKRNVFNSGEHDEYVVLEPVPVPVQPKVTADLTSISDEELLTELSRRLNK